MKYLISLITFTFGLLASSAHGLPVNPYNPDLTPKQIANQLKNNGVKLKLADYRSISPGAAINKVDLAKRITHWRIGPEFAMFQFVTMSLNYLHLSVHPEYTPTPYQQFYDSFYEPITYASFAVFKAGDETAKYGLAKLLSNISILKKANSSQAFHEHVLPYFGMGIGLWLSSLSHDVFADKELMACAMNKNFANNMYVTMTENFSEKNPCSIAYNAWIKEKKFYSYGGSFLSMATTQAALLYFTKKAGKTKLATSAKNLIFKGVDVVMEKVPAGWVAKGVKLLFKGAGEGTNMYYMFLATTALDQLMAPYVQSPIQSYAVSEKVDEARKDVESLIASSVQDKWASITDVNACQTKVLANCIPELHHAISHYTEKSQEWRELLIQPIITAFQMWDQKLTTMSAVYKNTYEVINFYKNTYKQEYKKIKDNNSYTLLFDRDLLSSVQLNYEADKKKESFDFLTGQPMNVTTKTNNDRDDILVQKVTLIQKMAEQILAYVDLYEAKNAKLAELLKSVAHQLQLPADYQLEAVPKRDIMTQLEKGLHNYYSVLSKKIKGYDSATTNLASSILFNISVKFKTSTKVESALGLGFRDALLNGDQGSFLSAQIDKHRIKIKNVDYMFYHFLCGRDVSQKKSSSVHDEEGYTSKFLIPKIVSNEYDLSSYCQSLNIEELTEDEGIKVFTTPISVVAKNGEVKKYTGLIEFLNENILPEIFKEKNQDEKTEASNEKEKTVQDSLDIWWKEKIDPSFNKSFDGFKLIYTRNIKRMLRILFDQNPTSTLLELGKSFSKRDSISETFRDFDDHILKYLINKAKSDPQSINYFDSTLKQTDYLWSLLSRILPPNYVKDTKSVESLKKWKDYIDQNMSQTMAHLKTVKERSDALDKNNEALLEVVPSKTFEGQQKAFESAMDQFAKPFAEGLPPAQAKSVVAVINGLKASHANLVKLLLIINATDFVSAVKDSTNCDELYGEF